MKNTAHSVKQQSPKNGFKQEDISVIKTNKVLFAFMAMLVIPLSGMTQSNTIEEVVVTVQKREENLQNVPIAVSAFTGESLTNYGVTGVQALQMVIPSLVYNNTGPVAQPYLRGIGSRLTFVGLEPSIATYTDDRYISRPNATLLDLADVERVEVLKGPQGTLYGRNATGGAIRVITKDPAEELEGSLTATVGNFDQWGVVGTISVPLTDTLSTRISTVVKRRDGYVDNIFPGGVSELDDRNFEAYRVKTLWNITDNIDMRLILEYWDQEDNANNDVTDLSPAGLNRGIASGGIAGSEPNEMATNIDDDIMQDEFSAQLRFDLSFDRFDLASITTYSDFYSDVALDADGTSARSLDVFDEIEESKTYSQEFQLLSNSDGDWDWLLGFYYFSQDASFNLPIDVGIPVLLSIGGVQSVDANAWAIFGQTTYHFNEQWSLTLGGRWNEEKKEVSVQDAPGMINLVLTPHTDEETWKKFTPKATLEYNMDNGLAYLSYARGFKSGGFNYPSVGTQALKPETLDMLELGWKAELFNNSMRINAALFYYDYKDLQVTRAASASGGGVTVTTENAANAKILGLEGDVIWRPTERITISGGLSLQDAEYKDYNASAKVFLDSLGVAAPGMTDVLFDADGESMLRTPDFSSYLSLQYDFTIGEANLPAVVTYSYKGDYDFDFVADSQSRLLTQDDYGLLSARISYLPPSERWSISLWGNNLTDEEYFDDVVGNSTGLRGSYAAPRTYGVDITFNF